jgi:hypothetical protein
MRGAIGLLTRIHVLAGYADGTFHPSEPFTRAHLATAFATVLSLPAAGAAPSFSDVSSSDPSAVEIAITTEAKLIVTPSATTFGPNDAVTRQDFAVSLARAFKLQPQSVTLTDRSQIASYAGDAVSAVVSKGYLSADSAGAFRPTATLTREEAGAALFLALRDNLE